MTKLKGIIITATETEIESNNMYTFIPLYSCKRRGVVETTALWSVPELAGVFQKGRKYQDR
jgi:hypothetical protein